MSSAKQELSQPILDFSLRLYDAAAKGENKSCVLSPLSVLFCLAMFHRGTSAGTEKEISEIFGVDKLHLFGYLVKLQEAMKKNAVLHNCIYVNKDLKSNIKDEYVTAISDLGTFDTLDTSSPVVESKKINSFVETSTKGLIKELISSSDITQDTIMILLNTIYFKSNWAQKFNKNLTVKDYDFHGGTKVDMMIMTGKKFRYFQNDKYQVMEMAYNESTCSMGFVLPFNKGEVVTLTTSNLLDVWTQLQETKLNTVMIPKFKTEYEVELVPAFKILGLTSMFDNAMVDDMVQNIKQQMAVSNIKHKAIIIVDEEGTEAAAATAMVFKKCALSIKPNTEFIADHPFTYYIRDSKTNTLLFLGHFMNM